MNIKQVGLIALVVVAVGVLIVSFKSSFMGGPAPKGESDAATFRTKMQESYKAMGTKGGATSGGTPSDRPVPPSPGGSSSGGR